MIKNVSTTILLLRAYFVVAVLSIISNIVNVNGSLNYVIYGNQYVFYAFSVVSLILSGFILYFFFKPRKEGYYLVWAYTIYSILAGVVANVMMFLNWENYQALIISFVENRYGEMSADKMVFFTSPWYFYLILAIGYVVMGVVMYYTYRNRDYFLKNKLKV